MIQAECKAAKARFIVAHIPELPDSPVSGRLHSANARAQAEALFSITQELHIETVDLLPGFLERKQKTGERLTFKRDPHWNRSGHRVAAEVLSEYLSSHPAK
jgi:hypothetical protein